MADLTKIGKNIRILREKEGLTQRALADNVLVSFQAISAWERGLSIPDLENVVRLADYFGVSVDALLASSNESLYVGIDGGGTKTEFVLFDAKGAVKRVVRTDGSNPNDRGIERCLEVLTEGLEQLLRGKTPKMIFAGIGGVSLQRYQKVIREHLESIFHTAVVADTDAANVLSMGKDPDNSMAVICGTGSCVFIRKGKERYRMGGWGYLLDQAGSAYDVGKDALRCTLAAEEGLIEENALTKRICKALGMCAHESISTIYSNGRPFIAGLAMEVEAAAQEGDATALAVLETNAKRLALLMKTAADRYGAPAQVVASGSFFKCEIFREMICQMSGLQLLIPDVQPIYGACVEALRAADVPICQQFYKNFTETYRSVSC